MFYSLRYYWRTAKGYRLRPWASPYIRWRMETFFGIPAEQLTAGQFLQLVWRERCRMAAFLRWAEKMESNRFAGWIPKSL